MLIGNDSERNGEAFERKVGEFVDKLFPHSRLSRVLLFRPDLPEHRRYGFEIDHLLHIREELVDRLIIVECKAQGVTITGGEWRVTYSERTKDAKSQLQNQAISLLRHLAHHKGVRQIRIEACLVSSNQYTVRREEPAGDNPIAFHLFNQLQFFDWLKRQNSPVQRVEQSPVLSRLRQGMVVAELGRPDIVNAIRFVAECRRVLDHELFRNFPGGMNWSSQAAINGTAGMGKSVMLAYILFVLSCDYFVEADEVSGTKRLSPLAPRAAALNLPKHSRRSIAAFGMSLKQVDILQGLWRNFVSLFGGIDGGHLLHFHQPVFKKWDAKIPDECNILVFDEAHDLPLNAQRIIAGWKNEESDSRYLLVACDRHQRLRLDGHGATIINGLGNGGFSRRTLRMRRNYRSPFPVYSASIGLMFRWFAGTGPKIIPSREELEGSFGFRVSNGPDGSWELSDHNDSHPGNQWSYTVCRHPSPQEAFDHLNFLRREDVLWVRFCEEDASFDYEQLAAFTYHPLDGNSTSALIDKYIKGQDFSIVVIEGLPAAATLATFLHKENEITEQEYKMWQSRRELYLCASRANVFLLFVLKPGNPGENEIDEMLRHVSTPFEGEQRRWQIEFGNGHPARRPGDIDNALEEIPPPPQPAERESVVTLHLNHPVTFEALVTSLGKSKGLDARTSRDQAVEAIAPMVPGLTRNTHLPTGIRSEIEDKLGVLIAISGEPNTDSLSPKPTLQIDKPSSVKDATEANLKAGITVGEAADALDLPIQKLLELLPLPYQQSTILNETDISRLGHLVRRTKPTIPLLQGSLAIPPTVAKNPDTWRTPLAGELWEFMHQSRFSRESKMVEKYVLFLSELVRIDPASTGILLKYRPRDRYYFSRSESEITRSSEYASVRPLRHGGLFAMCTLSNESKFTVLRKVLGDCGLTHDEIRRLLGKFQDY